MVGKVLIVKLEGYSGCELEIIEKDEKKYVRKSSGNPEYNNRLINQKNKQEALCLPNYKICHVYEDGFINDRYFFVMDYINGKTLADSMEQLELFEIQEYVDLLTGHFLTDGNYDPLAKEIFNKKTESLERDIFKKLGNDVPLNVQSALSLIKDFSWSHIIKSDCHGDLTMENILISRNSFYLIDCLDSFYNSWMIDAAKLLQDAELLWTHRKKKRSSNLYVRMTVFRDLLIKKIENMPDGKVLKETVYYILLLNILRIFPYADLKNDGDYLLNATDTLLKTITKENTL